MVQTPPIGAPIGQDQNTDVMIVGDGILVTDATELIQEDLDQAAYSLNTRPRQTLNWMTPSDKLAEALQ